MPTLGEELKRRREERNITLNEISEATRIGIRFLKAIDADNYSVLPGGIFTRSFIRAYAKEIGMSEDEAMTLYSQQTAPPGEAGVTTPIAAAPAQQSSPAASSSSTKSSSKASGKLAKTTPSIVYTPEPEKPRALSVPKTPTRTNWGTIIIGAGILIIIIVVVTALFQQLNKAEADKASQTGNTANPPAAAPQNQTAPPTSPPTQADGNAANSSSNAAAAPTTLAADAALVVKLEATDEAWIKYQVDDGQSAQTILKQGQVQEIPPAQNNVKINYGNRQVLKLVINNREASFPAEAPKFRSQIVITRDNLQSFFQ